MNLPELSHKQYAVLDCLRADELSGRELRARLGEAGFGKTRASFYQFMARLEDQKFVRVRRVPVEANGQTYYEHFYSLSGAGVAALNESDFFYASARGRVERA